MEGCIVCSVKNGHNFRIRNSSGLRASNAPLSTYLFCLKVNSLLNLFRFLPNSQVKEVCNTKFQRYMNSDDIHFMRGSYTIKPQIYLLIITHSMIRRFDAFSNRINFATFTPRCSCYVCVLRGIITDYSIGNT